MSSQRTHTMYMNVCEDFHTRSLVCWLQQYILESSTEGLLPICIIDPIRAICLQTYLKLFFQSGKYFHPMAYSPQR